jgi:hypothetical protein
MKNQFLKNILILNMVFFGCICCTRKGAKPILPPENPRPVADWIESKIESPDHSVRLTKLEMSKVQQEYWESQYKQTEIVQVPIDPKYNATLFKIKNVSEWEETVFIAPKIFVYGSAERGRLAPQFNSDGTISLAFPVVLTDATQEEITSADTTTKFNLPEPYLVKNLEELKATINSLFDGQQTLSALPGCLKKIILKVSEKEYDVSPLDIAKGDYCQLNMPLIATLKADAAEARYILQRALYAGAVEVRATFETRVAFLISKFNLEFDKSKLFEELAAEIKLENGVWSSADLNAKVTQVVKRQSFKINIQGNLSSYLDSIVRQATEVFFEKFNPDPKSETAKCSQTKICLRLNYNYSREQQNLKVSWEQSSSMPTGQNYLTWSKMKPLLDKVVDIGGSSSRPALKNNGSFIETGLTVVNGDILDIVPSYLIKEVKDLEIPSVIHSSNLVCIATEPVYERECIQLCTPNDEMTGCRDHCFNVKVGDQCSKYEDQFSEIITYTSGMSEYNRFDQPIKQLQEIFGGLALRFVWRDEVSGNLQELTCPLNLFEREGDGKKLVVRLENHATCLIFNESQKSAPMLYLVNQIQFPTKYKTGEIKIWWDSRSEDSTVEKTYYPEVQFAGVIAIRGYEFGSINSFGKKE